MVLTLQKIYNDDLVVTLDELKHDQDLVKQIEVRLRELALLENTEVDGAYTAATEQALKQFCDAAFLNNLDIKRFGRTFAKKLIEMPSPLSIPTASRAVTLNLTGSVGDGGNNHAADVLAIKNRLADLGFQAARNTTIDSDTIHTIRLFQSAIGGFTIIDSSLVDGRIDVNGATQQFLEAANAPRWQEMPIGSSAEGFLNHDHVQRDVHDFGTDWMIDTLKGAAALYRSTHLTANPGAALLTTNNLSIARGGQSPYHATHQTGLCCDLLLPRKDGTAGAIVVSDPAYDRNAMRAMLISLRQQKYKISQILLNDFTLRAAGLCHFAPGHDNHAHIDITPPDPQ
jgi:hypothetical protein